MPPLSDMSANASGFVPLCSYTLLPNGVHEFVFQESSRASVDQWVDQLVYILDTKPKEITLPIIVDTRQSGMLPIAYMIQKLRDIYLDYGQRPAMRLAFLSENNALMVFIQLLAGVAAASDIQSLQYQQFNTSDAATEWLLSVQ